MGFRHPGFVTGVTQEAALIPFAYPVICSAADPKKAYAAACHLAGEGADVLISFGLAGGLDPALKAGTLLLPDLVIAPDGTRYATAQSFHFPEALIKPIAGSDDLISSVPDKAQLFARTGAAAVDMESHAVARAAYERKLPFLVLRAIADGANAALPGYLAKATAQDGSTLIRPILRGLLRHPLTLPDLICLARASRKAFAALKAALPILLKD